MSNKIGLTLPVGRLVQGSLFDPVTTGMDGKPLVSRKTGQAQPVYYFAVAIPKGSENHWASTVWGQKIYAVGYAAFPQVAQLPTFAWKILNGDDQTLNQKGNRPCDQEGFAGHWIVKCSRPIAPRVYADRGTRPLDKGAVKLGDYIEAYIVIAGNASTQSPGIFINHDIVNFVGYGERIFVGANPESVGFTGELPAGASLIPKAEGIVGTPSVTYREPGSLPTTPFVSPIELPQHQHTGQMPPPYPNILNIPVPPVPQKTRVMTALAKGITYEQFKEAKWTDEMLISQGYMHA